jgi:hypothetical protein
MLNVMVMKLCMKKGLNICMRDMWKDVVVFF